MFNQTDIVPTPTSAEFKVLVVGINKHDVSSLIYNYNQDSSVLLAAVASKFFRQV